MLHSRLRPLPRPPTTSTTSTTSTTTTSPSSSTPPAPTPTFHNHDTDNDESPEDLFISFLPHLFPDDTPSFHGDPGQHLLYASPRYGPLEIMVPSYPGQSGKRTEDRGVEEGRKLFAHFLWSAAMVVAEGVENADCSSEDGSIWRVKGESVLELGAGAALPSVICSLAQASTVTTTDHPSSPALSSAMPFNTTYNLPAHDRCKVSIQPHEWGTLSTNPWALANKGKYTRIIAADCFWMRSQHENLVRTMRWFLAPGSDSDSGKRKGKGKAWVVAGFHTGRTIVAGFFETAVEMGLVVETIYERDLNSATEDGGEVRREWMPYREGEGPENRKRWCVVAVLSVP